MKLFIRKKNPVKVIDKGLPSGNITKSTYNEDHITDYKILEYGRYYWLDSYNEKIGEE